jgi:hypothetical protein
MESNALHFHPMDLNDGIHHCHEMMSEYEIHEKDGALERVLQVFHHYHKSMVDTWHSWKQWSIETMESIINCHEIMASMETM